MGIRFYCPNGHKLNVKAFQAGRRGICPFCGAKIIIPTQSTRRSSKAERAGGGPSARAEAEQEVVLQPDPVQQPLPVARQVELSTGPGGAARDTTAAGAPATSAAQGETLPVGTLVGFRGSASGTSPQRPGETAPPTVTSLEPSPSPVAQIPSAEPLQAGLTPQPGAQVPSPLQPPPTAPASDEPPDPLAESGNVVWYVRPPSGGQFGPATGDVMRTWISEGRVSADSLVWREGWRDWQAADKVFPQLGAGKNEFEFNVLPPSDSAGNAAAGRARSPRSRRQEVIRQVGIITSLILAVLVLVGVFVGVLIYYR